MRVNEKAQYAVMQINTVYPYGSTGKIAKGIQEICQMKEITCAVAYRYREKKQPVPVESMVTSSWLDCHIHNRLAKYTLLQGYFSYFRTKRFLKKIEKADVIHLHNLHGSYINLRLLFSYMEKNSIPVVWTLHDCWAFTGYCPYFDVHTCTKWHTGCKSCKFYIPSIPLHSDIVARMWRDKKQWFTGIKNMTLVTPSQWLADLVGESFLNEYPVRVINNGIDLGMFFPTDGEFRKEYGVPKEKPIILGVAFDWGYRKGLDVFLQLTDSLGDEYQIVLVGTNAKVDTQLPGNILSIHRTSNQKKLAEIYSAADVFVNPTREDNFPTVNIEALACGTPVITFRTGGSPEIIDETCGSVVECDDVNALEREIIRVCSDKPYSREACVKRAQQYDQREKFKEYVKLYEDCAHRT